MPQPEPILIGALLDIAGPPDGDSPLTPGLRAAELRFQEAVSSSELDRPVEVVAVTANGLPTGSAGNVMAAFEELASRRVLGIIGPGITDNCLVTQPMAEQYGIPTLNFPGTLHSRGDFGFHFQLGCLSDEGPLIVSELVALGHDTVAVVRDQSPIGAEYYDFFDQACRRLGLAVVCDRQVSPIATSVTAEVAAAKASGATALVHLGYGLVVPAIAAALAATGWAPPRFVNTAFLHGYANPAMRAAFEGWIGVDMVDPANHVTERFLDKYEKQHGERPEGPLQPLFYDIATMVVEGLRWAPVLTADGFRRGLERAHQLPTACGGAGTVMGFAPYDRAAYKGPDYLLFQEVRNGQYRPYRRGATDLPG